MTPQVGIADDYGGFALKTELVRSLRACGCDVLDFGAHHLDPSDDYPDFVIPLLGCPTPPTPPGQAASH